MVLSRISSRLRGLPQAEAPDVITFAVWTGIVFGLAEGVNAVIRRRVHHLPTGEYSWPELLWMPPLAAVITLTLIALVVVLGDRAIRARGRLLRFAPALLVGLGVYGAVRAIRPGIHTWAALTLAAGFAVALVQLPATWLSGVRRTLRWPLPLAMSAFVAWAFGVPWYRQHADQQSRKTLPPAAADAPNVLLVIWDAARAQSLSLYGAPRPTTPKLTKLAQGGTVFEHAFATSSWSLPSHASMYTGRDAHEIEIGRTIPLDDTYPTLAEVLARRGYVTGGFTGNLFYGSRDFGIGRGFSWYDDEAPVSVTKIATTWSITRQALTRWRLHSGNHQSVVRRHGDDVREDFLRWVDRRNGRPFFASINFFDAHAPYLAPRPFNLAFAKEQPRYWTDWERPTDPKVLRELETAYESCVLYLDYELGRLIESLRARGLLDNTLLIVTADHGEQFGDHGAHLQGHERSLYASVLRVPLVMRFPHRVPAGVRRSEVVSIRDIPKTVLDVLDIEAEEYFPGVSLLRYATGTATEAEITQPRIGYLEPSNLFGAELKRATREQHRFSVATGSRHYLVNRSGVEELYDFVRDPWETRNLMRDSSVASAVVRFRAILDSVDQKVMYGRVR
ncbi:MAG TPA: sulfatase-like hydrolase/transferase [Gemmatimonadaceae bacterium]|nr:sulfatase-like hydrolase/transferase [Gemmatimonadaceae bacterium]